MAILDNATQVSVLVDGLDHPEGIAAGADGFAYAGGEAGQIYRIDPTSGEMSQVAQIPGGFVLGLALDVDHNIYVCNTGNHTVTKITQGGAVSTYSTGSDEEDIYVPNYPAFDADGNMYVAASGDWYGFNGKIWKIAPGGRTEVWNEGLNTFPNGLCIGPGGTHLYVAMSLSPPRVVRVPILDDGSSGEPETVVELPLAVPDGLAFDTEGNLYISCYRPDRIYRLSPDSTLDVLAEDYEGTAIAAPTNVAFCGHGRDIFLSANLGRWHVTRYDLGKTGQALNFPKID